MKTFLRLLTAIAAIAFVHTSSAQQEFQNDYYVGFNSSSTLEVEAYFPDASSQTYTVSITNYDDIDVTVEFTSGCGAQTCWDNSTNVNHTVYFDNYWEYGIVDVDYLPSGVYTVTVTGPGINDGQVSVWIW